MTGKHILGHQIIFGKFIKYTSKQLKNIIPDARIELKSKERRFSLVRPLFFHTLHLEGAVIFLHNETNLIYCMN